MSLTLGSGSTSSFPQLYNTPVFLESSKEHQTLLNNFGFCYCTLLGKLLYAYVTCRPDIGYAVIALSKFANPPFEYHFSALHKVAKYLRCTKDWGMNFLHPSSVSSHPASSYRVLSADLSLSSFPTLECGAQLTCFIDAAQAIDLRWRRSTTSYAFCNPGLGHQ